MKRIVLTGGGTAGHVTPNLALIPHLLKKGWEIHYIGTSKGMEYGLLKDIKNVKYHGIQGGKLRRYFDLKNFTDPFRVAAGVFQAQSLIGELRPNVVFSKGGFVGVPVVLGAKLHGVPVVMHESDMTPGLANKICLPFAKAVCTTFPECAKALGEKGVQTGTPLRAQLFSGKRERGLRLCGFDTAKPVLMVIGGSLGAQAVNEAVRAALPELLTHYQVVHLCGKDNLDASLSKLVGYQQFDYLKDELPDVFACADIMLSRAGSNALSEIMALRKPALLIPYPATASRGDQILNAKSLAGRNLASMLAQEDMTIERLVTDINTLYENRRRYITALSALRDSDGTLKVLEQIEKFAKA